MPKVVDQCEIISVSSKNKSFLVSAARGTFTKTLLLLSKPFNGQFPADTPAGNHGSRIHQKQISSPR